MKKKLNVFLIVFVLGLWGTVFYRYLSQYLYPNDAMQVAAPQKILLTGVSAKDTFEMKNINRDPFLNSAMVERPHPRVARSSRPAPPKAAPAVKPVVPFPSVAYFGYIKAHQKEVALLKVNNKLLKLHTGETDDGLRVIKIFKDSIQVSFAREVRSIKRGPNKK